MGIVRIIHSSSKAVVKALCQTEPAAYLPSKNYIKEKRTLSLMPP